MNVLFLHIGHLKHFQNLLSPRNERNSNTAEKHHDFHSGAEERATGTRVLSAPGCSALARSGRGYKSLSLTVPGRRSTCPSGFPRPQRTGFPKFGSHSLCPDTMASAAPDLLLGQVYRPLQRADCPSRPAAVPRGTVKISSPRLLRA